MGEIANGTAQNPKLFDLLYLQSDEIGMFEELIYCLNEKLNGDIPQKTENCEAVNPAGGIMGFSDKNLKRLQNCRLRLGTLVEQI